MGGMNSFLSWNLMMTLCAPGLHPWLAWPIRMSCLDRKKVWESVSQSIPFIEFLRFWPLESCLKVLLKWIYKQKCVLHTSYTDHAFGGVRWVIPTDSGPVPPATVAAGGDGGTWSRRSLWYWGQEASARHLITNKYLLVSVMSKAGECLLWILGLTCISGLPRLIKSLKTCMCEVWLSPQLFTSFQILP